MISLRRAEVIFHVELVQILLSWTQQYVLFKPLINLNVLLPVFKVGRFGKVLKGALSDFISIDIESLFRV
jgi:hypothetical protein